MVSTRNQNPSSPIYQVIREINWALLASIAAHGLFFTLIFPQWYSQNQEKGNKVSNVPIIELNALEQTRLPNTIPNSFDWNRLQNLPDGDNSFPNSAIPLPPLPSMADGDYNFPVSNDGGNNDISSLPPPPPLGTNFNFSPPPPVNYNFELPNPRSFQLPPPPPLNEDSFASLPSPPPPPRFEINTEREIVDIPLTSVTPNNNNNQQITTVIEVEGEKAPVEQIIDAEKQAEIRKRLFANSPVEVTVNPRDVINNRNNPDSRSNGGGGNPLNVRQSESLARRLEKNPENTTDEEARKNYIEWVARVENVNPEKITIAGRYPTDACMRKLEGTTTYGVTVNPSGNVISSKLIKSSGYALFNEQALRQISTRQFPNNTGGNLPFHVDVNFRYDTNVCPSLTINNQGEMRNNTAPNPTMVNPPVSNPSVNTPPAETKAPNPPRENNITPNQVETNIIPEAPPKNNSVSPMVEQEINSAPVPTPSGVDSLDTPPNGADSLVNPIPTPQSSPNSVNVSPSPSLENHSPSANPRQMINQSPPAVIDNIDREVKDSSQIKLTE